MEVHLLRGQRNISIRRFIITFQPLDVSCPGTGLLLVVRKRNISEDAIERGVLYFQGPNVLRLRMRALQVNRKS